jgi:serine/threonine protein kinase
MGAKRKQQAPQIDKALSISQFRLGKKLGSGRFGNVYLAEERHTRTIWALKVMNKQKIREADMVDQVFWEIKLQIYMNHPNILKLYGFFDDAKNIYLVLEYCSQCLFKDFRTKVLPLTFRVGFPNRKLRTTGSRRLLR